MLKRNISIISLFSQVLVWLRCFFSILTYLKNLRTYKLLCLIELKEKDELKFQNVCFNHSLRNIYDLIWAIFRLLNLKEKNVNPLIKYLTKSWHLYVFKLFVPFRLSSIDMKYHIWKLGVVFTDNVSVKSGKTDSALWVVIRCHREAGSGRCPETFMDYFKDSVKGAGDTSVLCNSIKQMGCHMVILRSGHSP